LILLDKKQIAKKGEKGNKLAIDNLTKGLQRFCYLEKTCG